MKCNIRESGLGEFFWSGMWHNEFIQGGYKRRQEVEIWD